MATSTCFLCHAGSLDWVTSLTKGTPPGKQPARDGFVTLKERHTSHASPGLTRRDARRLGSVNSWSNGACMSR